MQDGRFGALGVVVALQLPGPQGQLDAPQQRRVRVAVELRIYEVRELPGSPVNRDEVCHLDLAEVGPAAAFVDAQERPQQVEGAAVNVQVVRQDLVHRGPLASFVDGGRVPGRV